MGVAPIPEHRQEANSVVKGGHNQEQAKDFGKERAKGARNRFCVNFALPQWPSSVASSIFFFLAFALFFIENDLYIKDLKNISAKKRRTKKERHVLVCIVS